MKDYLTVKEFAAAAGVSPQTIYKQIKGRLSGYVNRVDNCVKIKSVALEKVYGISVKPELTTNSTELTTVNQLLISQNEQLQETINFLRQQLTQKDQTITELLETVKRSQQIEAADKQLKLLEIDSRQQAAADQEIIEEGAVVSDPKRSKPKKKKKRKKDKA